MSFEDLAFDAGNFSGRVRLFPLPNMVLFPHVLQPLHIFEPRYRALMEEALADDRLIAMAVLEPGWESDYDGRPPLNRIACLGRIVTHQQTDDGKFNLLLAGLKRLEIVRELPPTKLFREAEVAVLEDRYVAHGVERRTDLQKQLIEAFQKALPKMPEIHQQLKELLGSEISLGMLTDLVAYTLQLPVDAKCELLGCLEVEKRCEILLERLSRGGASIGGSAPPRGLKWPPDFSAN